jgi:hypothetical protein
MNDRHIPDDRLIEICVTSPSTAGEQAHLVICPRCEARRVDIVGILTELDAAATIDAGVVFPDEKLERQHARILQRVDDNGRPGRVVAFPAQQPATSFLMPSRPRQRWAAAVAAAAFIAGIFTGQWTHRFAVPPDRTPVVDSVSTQALRAVPTTFSEEEFLKQVEAAGSRNGPAVLRPLDAMTPRAWEVR